MLTLLAGATGAQVPVELPVQTPVVEERIVEQVKQDPEDFVDTETYVRHYFADLPELVDVSFCESRFRQHDKNGNVLRGEINPSDVGVMQINLYYHQKDAQKLGHDLYTLEGNTAYARDLYEKQGLDPWVHSSGCWTKKPISSKLALGK